MRNVTTFNLVKAYTSANNVGWKTFYTRVLARMHKTNRYFSLFLQHELNELFLAEYEQDIVRESLALLVSCLEPLPFISYSTIEIIQKEFAATRQEKERLAEIELEKNNALEDVTIEDLELEKQSINARIAKRKSDFIRGGELHLVNNDERKDFYIEFMKYVNDVCGGDQNLRNRIISIVSLVIMVLLRQEDNTGVDQQIAQILNSKTEG